VVEAVKAEDIEVAKELVRFQGRRNWSTTTSTKQPEMKFYPRGIGRDAVTYDTVKDHIVQYVQKTCTGRVRMLRYSSEILR
jgi:hypothetical protein